eukprot:719150-Pelagomonas_calceolata.AAC.1
MDGKCVGMMTPDHFDVLYKAFHKAKALGLHNSICPTSTSFASVSCAWACARILRQAPSRGAAPL